jgi:hypothetical protein
LNAKMTPTYADWNTCPSLDSVNPVIGIPNIPSWYLDIKRQ